MSKRLPEVLNRSEINALLAAPDRKCPTGSRNYAMMLIMLRAGLRVSEACGLKPSDINWTIGEVRVIGKGDKERVIPLDTVTLDAMKVWKDVKPKGSPTFFSTLKGTHLDARYVNAMLERESKKQGIKHVHAHMFRHTYATDLLSDGFNIREVQELLGHSDLSTTMIYTHVNPVELRAKIQRRTM